MESSTIFDDVFRTMLEKMPQLAIPLIGHIESLNVSAAAAVMLFEAVRQRIAE